MKEKSGIAKIIKKKTLTYEGIRLNLVLFIMPKKKEGENMTVEEIEIIVTAQVEEALKSFKSFYQL